ncbi:MAG: FHA domain-containing protein [Elainellaceae cyanobacterium]
MLNIHELLASPAGSLGTITEEDPRLCHRLGLYQVFLRLYEQNQGLLEEILNLEDVGREAGRASTPYIQGLIFNQEVYLVTNLVHGKTQAIAQTDGIWTIGRDRRQAVVPITDGRLSRCHAAIKYDPSRQQFILIDLGSTNGSFVNGEMVKTAVELRDGDRIRLSSISFTFFSHTATVWRGQIPAETLHRVRQIEAALHSHSDHPGEGSLEEQPSQRTLTASLCDRRSEPVTQLQVNEDTALFLRSLDR